MYIYSCIDIYSYINIYMCRVCVCPYIYTRIVHKTLFSEFECFTRYEVTNFEKKSSDLKKREADIAVPGSADPFPSASAIAK